MLISKISSTIATFMESNNKHQQRPVFVRTVLIVLVLIIFVKMFKSVKDWNACELSIVTEIKTVRSSKYHGPPYLAYIISSVPGRFNPTLNNLNTILPGFFKIKIREPVLQNDSRIPSRVEASVGSLLLTNIDLWSELGWNSASTLNDKDWIFIFEDDVRIAPLPMIESFYGKINRTENNTNPNILLKSKYKISSVYSNYSIFC